MKIALNPGLCPHRPPHRSVCGGTDRGGGLFAILLTVLCPHKSPSALRSVRTQTEDWEGRQNKKKSPEHSGDFLLFSCLRITS